MAKPLIAMIDDEHDLVDSYRDLLSDKYDIKEFYSASEYIDFVSKNDSNPFDLIITDYRLGSETGLDMVEKADNLKRSAPFIVMSGYLDKETTIRSHNLGAHRILEKPVKLEVLDKEINELIYEGQIQKIRKETKDLTLQMKELCNVFDIFLEQHFSQSQIDDFFMNILSTDMSSKVSFRQYVANIEERLNKNIKMEEVLMKQIQKGNHRLSLG
jgi:response regulator RpfG family c-di-GMP phosphodiesterase